MKRVLSFFLCAVFFVVSLTSCVSAQNNSNYIDGTYNASFINYDSYGYKDYLRVVVEDGIIATVEYDAVNENGGLRSEDFDYEQRMEGQKDTYPRRYSADLVNRFLESKDLKNIDTIAGATWSSECFIALITALEENLKTGNTQTLLVENVPER